MNIAGVKKFGHLADRPLLWA